VSQSSDCPAPQAGIEHEIADLYEREASGILRYAGAFSGDWETARDALQEAFFRYFLCRSAGQRIQSPKAWMFRVARNYILDQKKAGSRNEVAVESLLNVACPASRPGDEVRVADLLDGLSAMGLSPREVECVRLRTEDLRYEEIARVLGLKSGTVGALLARAHDKIRKSVGDGFRRNPIVCPAAPVEKRYAS
jgi:RNA polymerase sigma-70 factor (ECF subfamily)